MASSCLLVLTACSTSAPSEIAESSPAAPEAPLSVPAPQESATETEADEPEADADETDEADTSDTDTSDTNASDTDTSNTDTSDTDDPAPPEAEPTPQPETEDEEPRFVLEGELPLTNADVNRLIDFIEQQTERPFLRPPTIVAQNTDDFIAGLTEDSGDFEAESELDIRALQSLGLTDQGVSEVATAFLALLESPAGALGYYDAEADKLFVPIDALAGDDFRGLLVHELTHALDGQYSTLTVSQSMLDEAELTGNFEPLLALQAVVEGRATWVQNRWLSANNAVQTLPDDLSLVETVPPAMLLSSSLPYGFGADFIDAEGGASETWDLLDDPPNSSEEFLVPGASGEEIILVPVPAADGPILQETVYGASDLLVWLLGESLEPSVLVFFPALKAIDGWAGGRSVMWGDDTETCTRVAFAADSSADLAEIQELLEDWAARDEGRTVVADEELVTATGCAPYLP